MLKKSRVTLAVALALPMVLTGCLATGGGSFNVEKVDNSRIIEGGVNSEIAKYQIVKNDGSNQPDVAGFSVEFPTEARLGKLQEKTPGIQRAKVDLTGDYSRTLNSDDKTYSVSSVENYSDPEIVPYALSLLGSGIKGIQWMTDFKNVKVGRLNDSDNNSSALFYFGDLGPMTLPTSGVVTYNGHFDVAVPYKNYEGRNEYFDVDGRYRYGSIGHSDVSLTVDFSKKQITNGHFDMQVGEVDYDYDANKRKVPEPKNYLDLTIPADSPWSIVGTSFSGELKGKAKINDANEINVTASADGSFFGANGDELAGRFISIGSENTPNGEFVGVFGAKAGEGFESLNKQAVKFSMLKWYGDDSLDESSAYVKKAEITKEEDDPEHPDKKITYAFHLVADNGGDLYKTLPIKGRFKNLVFAEFGEGEYDGGYQYGTLTGALSPNVPDQGIASYKGTWSGKGHSFANPSDLEADYEVNWQEKSLKGTLWGMNQSKATDSKDGFGKLEAQIEGNKFSGEVEFANLKADARKQTSITDKFSGIIKVKGGFFGPNANELAGLGAKPNSDGKTAEFAVMFSGKALETNSVSGSGTAH